MVTLTEIWGNIGSGNGTWRHQAITLANVDLSWVMSSDIHLKVISEEIHQPSIAKIGFKVTYLSLKIIATFPRGQWVKMTMCQKRVKFRNISAWQKLTTFFQQLAINRSNFNLNLPHQWHHMASLGHNELNSYLAVSSMLSQSWTESDTTTSLVPKGLNSIPTGLISTNQLA